MGVGKRKGNTLNAKICVLSNTFLREIKRSRVKRSYCSGSEGHSVVSDSLGLLGLYSPWNSPGQNTGVGSLSFLQGIFMTRNRTGVSCIAGGFLTNWATREAHIVRTWKYLNLLGRESLARYKKHNRIRWMSSKMFSFFWHQAIRKDLVLSDWD